MIIRVFETYGTVEVQGQITLESYTAITDINTPSNLGALDFVGAGRNADRGMKRTSFVATPLDGRRRER